MDKGTMGDDDVLAVVVEAGIVGRGTSTDASAAIAGADTGLGADDVDDAIASRVSSVDIVCLSKCLSIFINK